MEVLYVLCVGVLVVCGIFLILRVCIFLVVFGLIMLLYVVNLFLFLLGCLMINKVVVLGSVSEYVDLLL